MGLFALWHFVWWLFQIHARKRFDILRRRACSSLSRMYLHLKALSRSRSYLASYQKTFVVFPFFIDLHDLFFSEVRIILDFLREKLLLRIVICIKNSICLTKPSLKSLLKQRMLLELFKLLILQVLASNLDWVSILAKITHINRISLSKLKYCRRIHTPFHQVNFLLLYWVYFFNAQN